MTAGRLRNEERRRARYARPERMARELATFYSARLWPHCFQLSKATRLYTVTVETFRESVWDMCSSYRFQRESDLGFFTVPVSLQRLLAKIARTGRRHMQLCMLLYVATHTELHATSARLFKTDAALRRTAQVSASCVSVYYWRQMLSCGRGMEWM